MDSPGDISAALLIIESDGPFVGLHLNRGQSLLYISRDYDASHSPLCHRKSLSSVQVSVSLAAPSAPLPFVRGCFRTGLRRSGSLWRYCTRWMILNWKLPLSIHIWRSPNSPTSSALVLTPTSAVQPGLRRGHERDFGINSGWAPI